MGKWLVLLIELGAVAIATVAALILRDNFETTSDELGALLPYLTCSVFAAAAIFPAFGTHRALWRYTSVNDSLGIASAAAAAVISAVMIGFSYNRLEGVPRSLPILQTLLILAFLGGARVLTRVSGRARERRRAAIDAPPPLDRPRCKTALVVGIGSPTDLYLRCIAELAPQRVRVAGILGQSEQVGRLIHGYPVLGCPENAAEAVLALDVHGVVVDAVVVATDFDQLSERARAVLVKLERSGQVKLEFLAEQLGLAFGAEDEVASPVELAPNVFSGTPTLSEAEADRITGRSIWRLKRVFDFCLASALLLGSLPVMAAVAVGVAWDVGLPVTFWQQRPGRGGVAFKLRKFRTMGAAHDAHGHRVPDDHRLSAFGIFLRRSKLDELPQLFNILRGEMSFVGPRPLLPVDQPVGSADRLIVRPGLTGWAQVMGKRDISAADKTALDLWYLRHASPALDAKVLLLTLRVLVFGERLDAEALAEAWRDCGELIAAVEPANSKSAA